VYRGRRTLGIRIAPNGNWDDEFQHRLSQALTLALQLAGASIPTGTANLAYHMMVCLKLKYPLGVTQFSPDQLAKIASKLLSVQLPGLGFNRHMPRAVVFGPISMGDLYVEQGVRQIANLVGRLRQASETGRIMTIEQEWCQVQSGTGVNLLESPPHSYEYVKPCWIMSIQQFLAEQDLRIELTINHHPQQLCDHDEFIMDTWRHEGLSLATMKKLNAGRMWLRVSRLSEITLADGSRLHPDPLNGRTPHGHHETTLKWPSHDCPPPKWWSLWRQCLRRSFSIDGKDTKLRQPLGEWHASALSTTSFATRCLCPDRHDQYLVSASSGFVHSRHFSQSRERATPTTHMSNDVCAFE
jgi:hypothetical protein